MKKSMNIFLGILGAAAAGVAVGMLIAPQKGKKLRGDLKGSASHLSRKLAKLIEQGKDHYDKLKSTAINEADEFRNEADTFRQEANHAYKKAKNSVSN